MKKRLASIITVMALCLNLLPAAALATESDGLCEHHTEHTAECGYVEDETPCGFVCDQCAGEEPEFSEPEESQPEENQPEEDTATVLTDWEWVDDWEIIDPDSGNVLLPFASEDNVAYFEDIVELLPVSILAGGEELTLGDWLCLDYPGEGTYEGEYLFETALPEGYALPDGSSTLTLTVALGDPEGEPAAMPYTTGAWTYPTSQPTPTWTGEGTNESPFLITTAQQLADLAYLVNKGTWKKVNGVDWYYRDQYYKLGADIDLGDHEWTPIGTSSSSKPFNGHFDGNGKTISTLRITCSNGALFGYVGKGAEIKNLKISNAAVQASGSSGTGAIVGNNYGTISGCTVTTANITNSASSYVGAIAGYNTKYGTIDNCNVTGITMTLNGNNHKAGGIVGTNVGIVKNCTVGPNGDSSSITCTTAATSNVYIGGIVGDQSFSGASLENCTNYAKVEAWANAVGGIIGYNANSSVKNCKNYGAVISTWTDNQTAYAGGIVGQTNLLQEIAGQEVTDCENHGAVSGSAHQLGGIAGEVKGGLTACKNNGTVNGTGYYVGGIAGRGEKASISSCTNQGAVTGNKSSIRVGGIVGVIESQSSSITDCINYAAVTAADNEAGRAASYAGGIIGQARYTTTIEKCANVGEVTNKVYSTSSFSDDHCGTGGLIGSSSASGVTVSNCYNVGKVTGVTTGSTTKAFVGGLVGRRYSGSLSLTSVYNAGIVETIGTKGAIIGSGSVTVANCSYWDGCGAAGTGTARSANAMTDDTSWTTYLGLSSDIWTKTTNSGTTGYLPILNTRNQQSPEPTLTRTAMADQVLTLTGQPRDDESILTTLPVGYEGFTLSVSGGIEGATVTWSSSNPSVATVDANGTVSIQGVGDVTITATKDGNENTNAASVSYAFSVTQTITNVTVSNLGTFTAGSTPSFLASTQSDAKYHILDIVGIDASINPWDGTASGGSASGSRFNVLWKTESSYLKADSTFEIGKTYVGLFTLECDQYYNFAENLSIHLDGAKIAPTITTTKDATHANWLDVKIEFTVKPVIGSVSPSVVAPVKNAVPSTAVTPESGANYTAGTVTWSGSPSKFLGSTAYTATFTLTPNSDHAFTTETTATVSGATTVTETLNADGTLTVEATFPATDAPAIAGISVQANPSTTQYIYGEAYNPSGLKLTVTYDDGTTGNVTYSVENASAFTFTPAVLQVSNTSVDVTYGGKTATISGVTVSPKTIGIQWGSTTFTYDGSQQVPTATATGLESGDTCTITVTGGQINVGNSYNAAAASVSNSNYQLPADKTTTFSITPKALTVTGLTAVNRVYAADNTTVELTVGALSGIVSSDEGQVFVDTWPSTGTIADDNAGENKAVTFTPITLTGTKAGNYTLPKPTVTVNISQAEPDVGTVTKTRPDTIYTSTALGDITLSKSSSVAGELKLTAGQTLTAGEHDYGWTFTPSNTNYKTVTGTISLTVENDTLSSISASGTPDTTIYKYGETFQTSGLTVTATYASGATKNLESSEYTVTNGTMTMGQTSVTLSYQGKTCTVSGLTVNKADARTLSDISVKQKYTVTTQQSKEIGRAGMPADAGTLAYAKGSETTTGTVTVTSWDVDATGKVTFTLSGGAANDTVTLPVVISSTNYEPSTVKVVITLTDKDVPTVSANDITVTYTGSAVPASAITGTASVEGVWSFKAAAPKNVANSSDSVTVVFTPTDLTNYETVEDTIKVTINKATPTGTPAYTAISTSGKTLADAALTVGTITPTGTIAWNDGPETSVTANTAYGWTFTPDDTANYNNLTGSITPYVVSYSGGGSSGSSNTTTKTEKNPDGSTTTTVTDKTTGTVTETTKNTDGSTTVVETKKDGTVTETNKTTDGTTGTVVTDKNGTVTEVKSSVSSTAAKEAAKSGEAVTLPVEVPAVKTTGDAPAVDVTVPQSTGSVKVEIPVETVTPGTVAVIVKADGTEEIVKTSIPTENGVVLTLAGSATVKIVDNAKAFVDIHLVNHWAEDAVDFASARGITGGTSDTTFSPNASCTRAQIVTFLWRAAGSPEPENLSDFSDVSADAYYAKAVAWALENGITGGTGNGMFSPDATCTRSQSVTFLYRAAGSPTASDDIAFGDVTAESYYADAVAWAAQNGITSGIGSGLFGPANECSRAQIVTFLYRWLVK